jgi:hypothetical protein
MEAPPAAPEWNGPAVEFRAPLVVPPADGKKVRRPVSLGVRLWRKVVLIMGAVDCVLPVISIILALVMYSGTNGGSTMAFTGIVGVVVAAFWFLLAMTPWWIMCTEWTPAVTAAQSIVP